MQASSAATGSTSHTVTCAPMPRARIAIPFPTQAVSGDHDRHPREKDVRRANDAVHRGLARPVTESNSCFVKASLTATIG